MSKINKIITAQAFEIIRDRIGSILIDEINNQVVLSYGAESDAEILIESINPEDKENLPVINISFVNGTYSNKDYSGNVKASPYVYNIDIYTNAETTNGNDGDYLASIKLQKLIGWCRYILENPIYKTLGFQNAFINRVYCSEINIRNQGKNDAKNSAMGRITFNVETQESVDLIIPTLISGYETVVELGSSNQGYLYQS